MFVVNITYLAGLDEIDHQLEAHVRYLKRAYDDGYFIASDRKQPRTGGVIIARANNEQALWVMLKQDPFYTAGLADYHVTEFVPTMTAKAFTALLEQT